MVDMAKKVNKKSELMERGEECLAATVIMKSGQFKKSVTAGAIGGVVGHGIAMAMNKGDKDVVEGTMADAFEQHEQSILAITNQRWIIFSKSVMSGGPKDVLDTIAHGDIASLENEKGKLMNTLTLNFSDGSAVQMEAPKANKPERVVEAAAKLR